MQVPGTLGTACPARPSPRSHVHVPTLHPRPGGAAVPRPPGHEEARVRRRAVERLRGKGAARGEHRGGCPQVRAGDRCGGTAGGVGPSAVGLQVEVPRLFWSVTPSCYPPVQS